MLVEISKNELLDRMRSLQSNLTQDNEHTHALLLGFAIQALEQS